MDNYKDFHKRSNARYIQFPLFLLSSFYLHPDSCLKVILCSGVYNQTLKRSKIVNKDTLQECMDYLNLDINEIGLELDYILEWGKYWNEAVRESNKVPMLNISTGILKDFLINKKSKKQYTQLLCYLSMQSLLYGKPFNKTYYNQIFARMNGASSFKKYLKYNELNESQLKLKEDYLKKDVTEIQVKDNRFRTLLSSLSEDWGLCYNSKLYNGFRGVYFSFKLSPNEFNKQMALKLKERIKYKNKRANNMDEVKKYFNELED